MLKLRAVLGACAHSEINQAALWKESGGRGQIAYRSVPARKPFSARLRSTWLKGDKGGTGTGRL
jgi:hypothetical protein